MEPSVLNLSDKLRRESLRYKEVVELTECAKLLRYTSNDVNQVARRVNSGGGIYPDEVDEITAKLVEASGVFGSILEQLSKVK